jgi:hypothetical protein
MKNKNFEFDVFFKFLQDYFGLDMTTGTSRYYPINKLMTIHYNFGSSRIVTLDFKFNKNIDDVIVDIRIPIDYNFNQANGANFNGIEIQEKISEAIHYYSAFKKIVDVSEEYEPYLNISFIAKQCIDEKKHVSYQISPVNYNFEMTYNNKQSGYEHNAKHFFIVVENHLDQYFIEKDLEIMDSSTEQKINLYNMMEI